MAETKTKPTAKKPTAEYTVNVPRLNVRTAAGYSSPIAQQNGVVCILNKGKIITVSKTKTVDGETWGMIDTDKWVCLSFCTTE